MKNLKYFLFIVFIFCSCSKKIKYNTSDLSPAALEIFKNINYTEKQFIRKKQGKPWDYSKAEVLYNLSKLRPYVIDCGCWTGCSYDVTEYDIQLWKEWFEKNKNLLTYYENVDISKYYFQSKEKLIKFEYEPNKFRYSVNEFELIRITETAEIIKKRKELDKKLKLDFK